MFEPETVSVVPVRPSPPIVSPVPFVASTVKPAPVNVSPVPLVSEIVSPAPAVIASFEPDSEMLALVRLIAPFEPVTVSGEPAVSDRFATLPEPPTNTIVSLPPAIETCALVRSIVPFEPLALTRDLGLKSSSVAPCAGELDGDADLGAGQHFECAAVDDLDLAGHGRNPKFHRRPWPRG